MCCSGASTRVRDQRVLMGDLESVPERSMDHACAVGCGERVAHTTAFPYVVGARRGGTLGGPAACMHTTNTRLPLVFNSLQSARACSQICARRRSRWASSSRCHRPRARRSRSESPRAMRLSAPRLRGTGLRESIHFVSCATACTTSPLAPVCLSAACAGHEQAAFL